MRKLLGWLPWTKRRRPMEFARGRTPTLGPVWFSGGRMHGKPIGLPVFLSPGRSTTLRAGETHLEAMERLIEGEDL